MSRSWQRPAWRGWVVATCAAGQLVVFPLAAETVTNVPAPQIIPAATNLPSAPPARAKSPVDLFRELLAMTPDEQHDFLKNRQPAIRGRILVKLREYEQLDPDERELRLRATELRWYLLPLLHESPTNRAAQLATVPDDLRALVDDRITQWDLLPPPLQAEFFESERALRYFTHMDSSSSLLLSPGDERRHGPHGPDLAQWNSYSAAERQKITTRFNQFFELTPGEKQESLKTLSDAERQQMEKTLAMFGRLPPEQRQQCIRAFTEFAGLSAPEKQEFLENARRWSQMSPKERQTWRDLVTQVPEWPPLPVLATNHN